MKKLIKKMRNIILLILMLITITSCLGDSNLIPKNLFGGVSKTAGEGIRIEVLNYPNSLRQGQHFSIKVKLTNELYEQVEGRLCITDSPNSKGVIPAEGECLDSISLQPSELIEGRSIPYEETFNFPLNSGSYSYEKVDKEFALRTNFVISFKYNVKTKHGSDICLKNPQLDEEMVDIPCPDIESLSIQQPRTPIQITNVKKELVPGVGDEGTLNLQFTIQKDQDGRVIDIDDIYKTGISQKERIRVEGIQLGGTSFVCSPIESDNMIELRENERVINCYSSVSIQGSHIQDMLIINLAYGFEQRTNLPQIEVEPQGSQRRV